MPEPRQTMDLNEGVKKNLESFVKEFRELHGKNLVCLAAYGPGQRSS